MSDPNSGNSHSSSRTASFTARRVKFLCGALGVLLLLGIVSRFLDPIFGFQPGSSAAVVALLAIVGALVAGFRLVGLGVVVKNPEELDDHAVILGDPDPIDFHIGGDGGE